MGERAAQPQQLTPVRGAVAAAAASVIVGGGRVIVRTRGVGAADNDARSIIITTIKVIIQSSAVRAATLEHWSARAIVHICEAVEVGARGPDAATAYAVTAVHISVRAKIHRTGVSAAIEHLRALVLTCRQPRGDHRVGPSRFAPEEAYRETGQQQEYARSRTQDAHNPP